MVVMTTVEKIAPNTTNGYGLKVSSTYTSFDKKEIDFIEEQARKIADTVTVVEVKANGTDAPTIIEGSEN